jgi:hypothetical protein
MSSTRDAVRTMCMAIEQYLDGVTDVVRNWPSAPVTDSVAAKEAVSIRPFVMTAASHASLSIEDGGDHLIGLTKLVVEPATATACFTCIRSMLESCAIGAWLVDPNIDQTKRQARVFAFRRSGIIECRKFASCTANTLMEGKFNNNITLLEQEATAAGFQMNIPPDSKSGIGIKMPGATEMIRDVLGLDEIYRLLSGIAHGHQWARQIMYKQTGAAQVAGTEGVLLTKTLSTESFMLITHSGFLALTKLLWNRSRFWGSNTDQLEELVENAADQLQIKLQNRFWRSTATVES